MVPETRRQSRRHTLQARSQRCHRGRLHPCLSKCACFGSFGLRIKTRDPSLKNLESKRLLAQPNLQQRCPRMGNAQDPKPHGRDTPAVHRHGIGWSGRLLATCHAGIRQIVSLCCSITVVIVVCDNLLWRKRYCSLYIYIYIWRI